MMTTTEKTAMPRPAYFCYLFNEIYAVTFTFASREFPSISVCWSVRDTINLLEHLDLWPLSSFTGYSILPILDFLSLFVLELRQGTRQTDGQTPSIIL